MARSRNIKPSIMDNEELAELDPLARLLFIYLWMLADREGRLEDRPKRIAAQALPYDRAADVNAMLNELQRAGFIARYVANGQACIQVLAFKAHQTPHVREAESSLPAFEQGTTKAVPEHNLGSAETSPRSPDSGFSDPGLLIPDSKATSNDVAPARPVDEAAPQLALVSKDPKPWAPPDCPHQQILAVWAEVLPAMPQHLPAQWKGSRADHLRARWRETAEAKKWGDVADGIDYFRRLFAYIGQSRFLTGRTRPKNPDSTPFVIELEWLVSPLNWAKVHEGKYHQDAA